LTPVDCSLKASELLVCHNKGLPIAKVQCRDKEEATRNKGAKLDFQT
jgi:hypothetical protein